MRNRGVSLLAACGLALLGCKGYDEQATLARLRAKQITHVQVDAAFRALADSLQPIVRARDSALAVARRDSGTAAADSVLPAVEKLMNRLTDYRLPSPQITAWLRDKPWWMADTLVPFMRSRSLWVRWNDGIASGADHAELLKMFGPYLTPAFRTFEHLLARDDTLLRDGRVVTIHWDSIEDHIADWDRFMDRNPTFSRIAVAQQRLRFNRDIFLTGTDTSKIFVGDTVGDTTLSLGVKLAFEDFLKRFPNSRAAPLVTEYLEVLRANGYVKSRKLVEFLESRNVRMRWYY